MHEAVSEDEQRIRKANEYMQWLAWCGELGITRLHDYSNITVRNFDRDLGCYASKSAVEYAASRWRWTYLRLLGLLWIWIIGGFVLPLLVKATFIANEVLGNILSAVTFLVWMLAAYAIQPHTDMNASRAWWKFLEDMAKRSPVN